MAPSHPSGPSWHLVGIFGWMLLGVFTVTRLVLLAVTGIDDVPLAQWPTVLTKGLGFDLVVVLSLAAPAILYELILPDRIRGSRRYARLRLAGFAAGTFAALFIAIAEVVFWLEFSSRFNFIAVDYLLYTHEVIRNIWESYPIGWLLAALLGTSIFATAALRSSILRASTGPFPRHWRLLQFGVAAALASGLLATSTIDMMEIPGNRYAGELAGNGWFTFAAALRRNELDYDQFYETIPEQEAASILARLGGGQRAAARLPGPADAPSAVGPLLRRPRNVVLISVESLSASFLGAYGSNAGLTPRLDALAADGMRFENVYATGTRTVRGLEALSVGTPPIPGQAIVRRPGNDHLATLGSLLRRQGYEVAFVYGGHGYFDNMNAYFAGNGYRVVDRTDFPAATVAFENVWGVADESLFVNALEVIDASVASGRPSFTHIMTTSNHRPYTYPDGRIDIASPGGREGAIKYTDWAIGAFIDAARSRPWFTDTLFVIVADHCAAVAGRSKIPVASYRIPLILYGPDLVAPSRYHATVSQVDIPPTVLDMLGAAGSERLFGRSVFAEPRLSRAFVSNYQALGYLRDDVLTVLSPGRRIESFAIDPETFEATRRSVDPALASEAIAYYQTAARSFRNGKLRIDALEPNPLHAAEVGAD